MIMPKIPPIDDVAALEAAEKAEKRTMCCEGVPHLCKHVRKTETSCVTVSTTGGIHRALARFVRISRDVE